MIREKIAAAVKEALAEIGADCSFAVERPASFEHGEYATNAALVAAKVLKKNPLDVAAELRGILEKKLPSESIQKIEVAGAGFINVYISRVAIASVVSGAAEDPEWGKNHIYEGKKVLVEYTDPNPFKEFHIGHLMSNAIGESIARLFEISGANVSRANYQGDVGVHVAKAIWAKQKYPELSWGEAYVRGSEEYDAHKEEIDLLNKVIYEKSDPAVDALYAAGRKESLDHFEELYKILGTHFSYYFFESDVGPIGLRLVQEHPEIFEKSDGAVVFRGENYGLHTRVFVNSQGLPTYEAKELGLVEAKQGKGKFDLSLTVTASEISDYFKVVRKAAELVFPDLEGKMLARFHGFMRLVTGKMSSRKGNVVTGESLLEDLQTAAKEKMGERKVQDSDGVARHVAVGAIKYVVLRQGSGKDIVFDPAKSLSLEGDSGPYLQYAHTRALSLLRAAEQEKITAETSDAPADAGVLERLLLYFPEIIAHAAEELEPHYVTTYLAELAGAFNSWYTSERVIGGSHPHYGVLLTQAVERTLKRGLMVLGIPVPEEM